MSLQNPRHVSCAKEKKKKKKKHYGSSNTLVNFPKNLRHSMHQQEQEEKGLVAPSLDFDFVV
jgi:hypothetical protein